MKKIIAGLLLFCSVLSVRAQEVYTSSGRSVSRAREAQKEREKGFDINRMIVGGTLGFGMGGNTVAFSIAPVVGYRITDNFAAGIGFGYQYFKEKDYFAVPGPNLNQTLYYDYKASMISASVWTRYVIITNLFVHAEYEHNFMSYQDYRYDPGGSGNIVDYKIRMNVPSLLLGAGFRQPVGEHSSMYIMGFYDVLQRDFSPYKGGIQPRIGFTLGF